MRSKAKGDEFAKSPEVYSPYHIAGGRGDVESKGEDTWWSMTVRLMFHGGGRKTRIRELRNQIIHSGQRGNDKRQGNMEGRVMDG